MRFLMIKNLNKKSKSTINKIYLLSIANCFFTRWVQFSGNINTNIKIKKFRQLQQTAYWNRLLLLASDRFGLPEKCQMWTGLFATTCQLMLSKAWTSTLITTGWNMWYKQKTKMQGNCFIYPFLLWLGAFFLQFL